jgi:25S rRNA (adenine2142-N1)-methyltransferase
MCYQHLQPKGILFLMIPLLCLRNSKKMTYERFCDILKAVGFHIKETKDSPKVSFFCLEKAEISRTLEVSTQGKGVVLFPEKVLAPGSKRNDFSVVI